MSPPVGSDPAAFVDSAGVEPSAEVFRTEQDGFDCFSSVPLAGGQVSIPSGLMVVEVEGAVSELTTAAAAADLFLDLDFLDLEVLDCDWPSVFEPRFPLLAPDSSEGSESGFPKEGMSRSGFPKNRTSRS